jgi:lycopene cyclase domain-containing protein
MLGTFYFDRWYTGVTVFSLALFLAVNRWYWSSTYMGRFYLSYLFVLISFFIVNGVLTDSFSEQEVVWYTNQENMNLRLGTIPIGDFFYNMLMLLMVTTLYEGLKK